MRKRRLLVVINPISGTFDKKGLDKYIASHMREAGIDTTIKWTGGKGDGTRLAIQAENEGYDGLVAVGGDGTINECASGLCNSNVVLGIVPLGSGNGLARHLSIPFNIDKALKTIEEGHVKKCDFGTLNSHPFFCTSGIGFDASVSAKFAEQKRRGRAAYLRSALQEYIKYHPSEYIFKFDGKIITYKASVVAICNASQYGSNAYIAPGADISDGLLDIKILHAGNVITDAMAAVDLMTGNIDKNFKMATIVTDDITIVRPEPGLVHIDGDPISLGNTLHAKCHKGGLNVYTKETDEKFMPIITPIRSSFSIFSDIYLHPTSWKKKH